ncbi:MAG: HlyD family efflux transporter periplasmic adaptor subunit [Pseudomonadota bacterium]
MIEGDLREARSEKALQYFICNEVLKLVPGREAILFVPGWKRNTWKAVAASGVTQVEATAPAITALAAEIAPWLGPHRETNAETPKVTDHRRKAKPVKGRDITATHVALTRIDNLEGQRLGILVLPGQDPLAPEAVVMLERLAGAFGHAWSFFDQKRNRAKRIVSRRRTAALCGLLALAAMAIPVPMSILAPMEVVAANPFVVTAPFDGVVDEIAVAPNAGVAPGDLLVQFNDVDLRSRLAIAESEARVADARQRQILQGASLLDDMRRDLSIVRAELDLAVTELAEAKRQFELSQLRADVAGTAVFASREDWQGRPVSTGERIMEIADPERLELRIEVALGDSVVLDPGSSVRVFPDHDPFRAFDAQFVTAAFRAEPVADGRLAYLAKATFDRQSETLRLGQRGTARVSKGSVALGYYLFRRPIALMRQWTGI